MNVLITGVAGFIGFHLADRLLAEGHHVTGVDNMNDYYDVALKQSRLDRLTPHSTFTFHHTDLADLSGLMAVFDSQPLDVVVNLAAQAGVRFSIENPQEYLKSNMQGFLNLLECCRKVKVGHLIYASSSSVYGLNKKMPLSTDDSVDHPVSFYAATKKSNELMAHTYSHLYSIPTTGLRFFTVYGPWGRPDMALFKFTKAILAGQPIDVYNNGEMYRDFTYIDDIVESMVRLLDKAPQPDPNWTVEQGGVAGSSAPYALYNIGNSHPVKLLDYIKTLEDALGIKAQLNLMPMQPGDVMNTSADTTPLYQKIDYKPSTPIDRGVAEFVRWYQQYYQV